MVSGNRNPLVKSMKIDVLQVSMHRCLIFLSFCPHYNGNSSAAKRCTKTEGWKTAARENTKYYTIFSARMASDENRKSAKPTDRRVVR